MLVGWKVTINSVLVRNTATDSTLVRIFMMYFITVPLRYHNAVPLLNSALENMITMTIICMSVDLEFCRREKIGCEYWDQRWWVLVKMILTILNTVPHSQHHHIILGCLQQFWKMLTIFIDSLLWPGLPRSYSANSCMSTSYASKHWNINWKLIS